MSNTVKKDQEDDYQALYEELESRYGAGLAQQIVDEIKKTEDKGYIPDFMPVKALSEALEIFRPEAQTALKRLKAFRACQSSPSKDVVDLDEKRILSDFARKWGCYRQVQHGFYTLYHRAMQEIEVPDTDQYRKISMPPKMRQAA